MSAVNSLDTLVFYAIDIATPYDLALHSNTNSLQKIMAFKLVDLEITKQGLSDMWLIINAYGPQYGGKQVAPDKAMACKTVADVRAAV